MVLFESHALASGSLYFLFPITWSTLPRKMNKIYSLALFMSLFRCYLIREPTLARFKQHIPSLAVLFFSLKSSPPPAVYICFLSVLHDNKLNSYLLNECRSAYCCSKELCEAMVTLLFYHFANIIHCNLTTFLLLQQM